MSKYLRSGGGQPGGSLAGYPHDKLYQEVAFIAYYFHWPHDDIMNMEHEERRKWCEEISKINKKLNQQPENENIFKL